MLISLVIIMTAVLPCVTASAAQTGVVYGGWLILRASPSFSGAIKSSYPSGTVVTITGKTGAWYAVKAPDGLTGYMLGDYLRVSGSGGGGTVPSGSTAYVTSANGLNVRLRSGPGTGYSIIASYAPGTACKILSSGKNWCRIQIGSFTGYMMTRFLTGNPVTPTTPPQPHPGPEYEVYVTSRNGKGVNLRSGPSKSYQSIGFYSVGTPAMMITRGSTWSYIRVGNRYGYMMTEFLTTVQPPHPEPPAPGAAYVVSANGKSVNLRVAPSTGSKVIKSFRVGTGLNIITRGHDWYFIQIGGYYGYMMRQFIYDGGTPVPPAPGPAPEPKPDEKPDPKPDQKPDTKPDDKPDQKPDQKPDTGEETGTDPGEGTGTNPDPQPGPGTNPDHNPEQEPGTDPATQTDLTP